MGKEEQVEHRSFLAVKILSWYDSTVVETSLYICQKPIEHAAPGLKPDVDCGPCVIRMCLHRFLRVITNVPFW